MKDECNGKPPLEFVGLQAKMYSLLTYDDRQIKRTAKGIKKVFCNKTFEARHVFANFTKKDDRTCFKYRLFRSRAHKLETVNASEIALCAYDDKR